MTILNIIWKCNFPHQNITPYGRTFSSTSTGFNPNLAGINVCKKFTTATVRIESRECIVCASVWLHVFKLTVTNAAGVDSNIAF